MKGKLRPTKLDCAYAAGFFDGEGCVCAARLYGGKGIGLIVTVSQNTISSLEWLKDRWGGNILEAKHIPRSVFRWQCPQPRIEDFLVGMLPYLKVKGEQARLGIKFRSLIDTTRCGRSLPPDNQKLREEIMEKMKGLNRGIRYAAS